MRAGTQENLGVDAWSEVNRLYLYLSGQRAQRRFQASPSSFTQRSSRPCILFDGLVAEHSAAGRGVSLPGAGALPRARQRDGNGSFTPSARATTRRRTVMRRCNWSGGRGSCEAARLMEPTCGSSATRSSRSASSVSYLERRLSRAVRFCVERLSGIAPGNRRWRRR